MSYLWILTRRYSSSLWQLTRIVPVISWSFAAIVLAVGLAYHDLHGWRHMRGSVLAVCILCAGILQGIVAHAFNDRTDWNSGTDQKSDGILSGGSRVILHKKLSYNQLFWIGLAGICIACLFGIYLSVTDSILSILFLVVGIWGCISYSCRPFCYAYRPFIGEWGSAFPAMVACSVGTFYVLTNAIHQQVWVMSVLHSLLCVSWLMQHHLSDIKADQLAIPRKITTVVWVTDRWGIQRSWIVPASYFGLTCAVSLIAIFVLSKIFLISLMLSLLGIYIANRTDPQNIASITKREKQMIGITIVHAIALAIAVNLIQ